MRLKNKRFSILLLVLCLIFVFFVTLFTRMTNLNHKINYIPFVSYQKWFRGSKSVGLQILKNIALFVPLGYFIAPFFRRKWMSAIAALLISLTIEILQYVLYRGLTDIDDVFSNTLGAIIGIFVYDLLEMHNTAIRMGTTAMMAAAGMAACIISAIPSYSSILRAEETRHYDFSVSSVQIRNDVLEITGSCYMYTNPSLEYSICFRGIKGMPIVKTERNGDGFVTTVSPVPDGKIEPIVWFKYFLPSKTRTYICTSRDEKCSIEYVDVNVTEPKGVPKNAILKSYSSDFDTYVYQLEDKLIWLIGYDIDETTEIIYHIYAAELDKLPKNRAAYGFENRGFRVGSIKEVGMMGHYRLFEDILPDEYNISAVSVGFNTKKKITWADNFRVD